MGGQRVDVADVVDERVLAVRAELRAGVRDERHAAAGERLECRRAPKPSSMLGSTRASLLRISSGTSLRCPSASTLGCASSGASRAS